MYDLIPYIIERLFERKTEQRKNDKGLKKDYKCTKSSSRLFTKISTIGNRWIEVIPVSRYFMAQFHGQLMLPALVGHGLYIN